MIIGMDLAWAEICCCCCRHTSPVCVCSAPCGRAKFFSFLFFWDGMCRYALLRQTYHKIVTAKVTQIATRFEIDRIKSEQKISEIYSNCYKLIRCMQRAGERMSDLLVVRYICKCAQCLAHMAFSWQSQLQHWPKKLFIAYNTVHGVEKRERVSGQYRIDFLLQNFKHHVSFANR